jgi:hypothetical protein
VYIIILKGAELESKHVVRDGGEMEKADDGDGFDGQPGRK